MILNEFFLAIFCNNMLYAVKLYKHRIGTNVPLLLYAKKNLKHNIFITQR